jgi:hypothetical protein
MTAFRVTISVVAFGLLLGGCATNGTSLPSFGCTAFKPISWSRKDTRPTVRQIVGHNAVGKKLCDWSAK